MKINNEELLYIIESIADISKSDIDSDNILELFSFIVSLLKNNDPKYLTKTYLSRKFKIKRLIIDIKYDGKLY